MMRATSGTPLRIGIIGCGRIAQVRHAPEYDDNPHIELVAYYDAKPERAQALADLYGGQVCGTLDELLSADLDAVSVCVANNLHAEVSIRALNAGFHVLCEKPMATTPEECRAMVEASSASGKRLMIGLNQRFASAHARAKEILDSGALGTVISFQTSFCHPGPESWAGKVDTWFFDKKIAVFGVMADLGVHKTDLISYLIGEPIVETSAVLRSLDKKMPDGTRVGVDDNAFAIYTMAGGATGTMHVSWTNYGTEHNATRIYCTGGVLRLYDDPEYSLVVETPEGIERFALDRLTSNEDQTSGMRTSTGVIDGFVESVLTGSRSIADGDDAVHAMDVTFANQRSSETGKAVRIDTVA